MWQDYMFAVGSLILGFGLLPSVFSPNKPSLGTSIPTMLVLYAFALTYFQMYWYYASIVTLATASLWAILALQKWEEPNLKD